MKTSSFCIHLNKRTECTNPVCNPQPDSQQVVLETLRHTVAALDQLLDQHAERGTYMPNANRVVAEAKAVIAKAELQS